MTALAALVADNSGISKNTLEVIALAVIIIVAILFIVGRPWRRP